MSAPETTVWTPALVRELQSDDRAWPRYELIDGELLVTPGPAPPHQRVHMELIAALLPYVRQHRIGHLLSSPADIELDDRSVVQPDLFVVPPDTPEHFASWREVRGLVLAIEIVSPSSARQDRGIKRDYFQRHRVPEYWVVDPPARLVERWRPEDARPEVCREGLTWRPDASCPPLTLALPTLFAAALGA